MDRMQDNVYACFFTCIFRFYFFRIEVTIIVLNPAYPAHPVKKHVLEVCQQA